MDQKQRLFIYDRKEMIVLISLAVMVALFSFTLGVHLGKRVGIADLDPNDGSVDVVDTVGDPIPTREELSEEAKTAADDADGVLNQALHEEVKEVGIKLDQPIQTGLPQKPKSANAGATQPRQPKSPAQARPESGHATSQAFYTLQVGSYRTMSEANLRVQALEKEGVHPKVRPVQLKDRGQWFRVTIGEYTTQDEATLAGVRYKAKNLIGSYVVAKVRNSQ